MRILTILSVGCLLIVGFSAFLFFGLTSSPTVEMPNNELPTVELPTVELPTVEEKIVKEPIVEEKIVKEPTVKEPMRAYMQEIQPTYDESTKNAVVQDKVIKPPQMYGNYDYIYDHKEKRFYSVREKKYVDLQLVE